MENTDAVELTSSQFSSFALPKEVVVHMTQHQLLPVSVNIRERERERERESIETKVNEPNLSKCEV